MTRSLSLVRSGLVFALMMLPVGAAAKDDDVSVVLVHGAFSDGSAWRRVIPILQDAGVTVSAAQLPLSSLEGDAAVVSRLIEAQNGPVVLVGHSYGGNVITEAGARENVEALVYVAGFALDAGQSLKDLLDGKPPAPWQTEASPDSGGYVHLSQKGVAEFFAPDLPASETAVMAATQGPINYKINYEAPKVAAWSLHPTYYVLTENDQIVPPRLQGFFAKRMGAKVTSIASSHVAMLSQPQAVAQVILDAVAAVYDD
ncbi:MAG: alpha/beta hydrolase [Pseudomonadota bacterium]